MITLIDTVASVAERTVGPTYFAYPRTVQSDAPYAVVTETSRRSSYQEGGDEVVADMTYLVDVYAKGHMQARTLATDLAEALQELGMTVGGMAVEWDPVYSRHNVSVTVDATADKRGAVYHR